MARFQIPLIDQARQAAGMQLGGQSLRIAFAWQPSDKHWYMSLRFRDGRSIVEGVRVITGANLTEGAREGFKGTITAESIAEDGSDPGRHAWRDRTHRIIYEEADDD